MAAAVTVRVPGSTSNLGSGFDCLGIAVDRWLCVTARPVPVPGRPVAMERRGTLRALTVPAEGDLVYVGLTAACRRARRETPPSLALTAESDIPIGRGLGSSAAALVAGAALANALLGLGLDRDGLVALCADIERHPDNVAPAVHGGATLAVRGPNGTLTVTPLEVHPSLVLVFAVPDFAVETERARAVLPDAVSHALAVAAAARSAALVRGLACADAALLAAGLDDLLHVPYRRALVPGYDAVTAAARAAGAFGATLSGSGSAVVAVAAAERATAVEAAMAQAWRTRGNSAETFWVTGRVGGYTEISIEEA